MALFWARLGGLSPEALALLLTMGAPPGRVAGRADAPQVLRQGSILFGKEILVYFT